MGPGECLQQTLHMQTDGHASINSEFNADQILIYIYVYFTRSLSINSHPSMMDRKDGYFTRYAYTVIINLCIFYFNAEAVGVEDSAGDESDFLPFFSF